MFPSLNHWLCIPTIVFSPLNLLVYTKIYFIFLIVCLCIPIAVFLPMHFVCETIKTLIFACLSNLLPMISMRIIAEMEIWLSIV